MMSTLRSLRRVPLRRLFSSVTSNDGLSYRGLSLPYRWLRDSCQCPSCIQPSTQQKLHRTSDVPSNIRPVADGVRYTHEGVHITWTSGHESHYPQEFLERYALLDKLRAFHKDVDIKQWDVKKLEPSENLLLSYGALHSPSGLLSAITQLTQYGLLFVSDVPNDKTSNEDCELRRLAQMFGEIRETFYGQTWDVKNVRNSKNIAYTDVHLDLHMDLLYFQHPPRFQILHCLRNRVSGGMSIFVDALHAASRLRSVDPDAFRMLTETPVGFHYINDGHHLHYAHPTIELAQIFSRSTTNALPKIAHINYSPPFQAPLTPSTPAAFYPALQRFVALLEDPGMRYEYTLREGDAVLFDNRRVLHARTAFSEYPDADSDGAADTTNRWLKGCYLEADAVFDRGRVLRQKLGQ